MAAVLYARSGAVARITLNRPSVLNAADEDWVADLNACADRAATDPDVRVVVVEGNGRAFCTGIDLAVLAAGRVGPDWFGAWGGAMRAVATMARRVGRGGQG